MGKCLHCGTEIVPKIDTAQARYETNRKKFCTRSCAASYNNKLRVKYKNCLNCSTQLNKSKKSKNFCNTECLISYRLNIFITDWKNGLVNGSTGGYTVSKYIRKYLLKKYNNSCQICNWSEINIFSKKIPLQLHHIDGDCLNSKEDNLQILCPNCHSLTPTFGSLNKNSKRIFRKQKIK